MNNCVEGGHTAGRGVSHSASAQGASELAVKPAFGQRADARELRTEGGALEARREGGAGQHVSHAHVAVVVQRLSYVTARSRRY
jgi:hypothetical protein